MSRVRGGNNTTEIRIGNNSSIQSFVEKIDVVIVLGKNALYRLDNRIDTNTIIVGESRFIPKSYSDNNKVINVPFMKIADDAGGIIMQNTVILGFIFGFIGIDLKYGENQLAKVFGKKGEQIINNNITAFRNGAKIGLEHNYPIKLKELERVKHQSILCGTDGVGIGALAGGCNFMAAYPMSPGTGVLEFLAKQADDFGVVVEQAEDEIAAINMALGAWYAGARGMTTTSGGGFALMEEGISLSGIIEVPVVVHIGMRPGPATGLPTRTEQGDLHLAVFAGHGEFPKVVFAPGTPEQCISVTKKAFETADKYKVPVIILTDQYLLDSYSVFDKIDFNNTIADNDIVETNADYKTYEITPNGLSPRGVPSFGDGFVCADSDEHDELGRITESDTVRVEMMDKRLRKTKLILEDNFEYTFLGDKNYSTLILSWGSTYGVISEAFENIEHKNIAYVHFTQLFPLPKQLENMLKKAERVVVIENNATAQFAKLIQMELGVKIENRILQYNGFPFSLEKIVQVIENEVSIVKKQNQLQSQSC
jgi:2-oxoglutarate/2-oxoacid ferredoxin oxidoreductase subunit alpha